MKNDIHYQPIPYATTPLVKQATSAPTGSIMDEHAMHVYMVPFLTSSKLSGWLAGVMNPRPTAANVLRTNRTA